MAYVYIDNVLQDKQIKLVQGNTSPNITLPKPTSGKIATYATSSYFYVVHCGYSYDEASSQYGYAKYEKDTVGIKNFLATQYASYNNLGVGWDKILYVDGTVAASNKAISFKLYDQYGQIWPTSLEITQPECQWSLNKFSKGRHFYGEGNKHYRIDYKSGSGYFYTSISDTGLDTDKVAHFLTYSSSGDYLGNTVLAFCFDPNRSGNKYYTLIADDSFTWTELANYNLPGAGSTLEEYRKQKMCYDSNGYIHLAGTYDGATVASDRIFNYDDMSLISTNILPENYNPACIDCYNGVILLIGGTVDYNSNVGRNTIATIPVDARNANSSDWDFMKTTYFLSDCQVKLSDGTYKYFPEHTTS